MKHPHEIRQKFDTIVKMPGMPGTYAGSTKVNGVQGNVIWGRNEEGWEHVSFAPWDNSYIPSWEDMCALKRMFWKADEPVIQFIPAEQEYVNIVSNCMHLWSPKDPVIRKGLSMPIRREND